MPLDFPLGIWTGLSAALTYKVVQDINLGAVFRYTQKRAQQAKTWAWSRRHPGPGFFQAVAQLALANREPLIGVALQALPARPQSFAAGERDIIHEWADQVAGATPVCSFPSHAEYAARDGAEEPAFRWHAEVRPGPLISVLQRAPTCTPPGEERALDIPATYVAWIEMLTAAAVLLERFHVRWCAVGMTFEPGMGGPDPVEQFWFGRLPSPDRYGAPARPTSWYSALESRVAASGVAAVVASQLNRFLEDNSYIHTDRLLSALPDWAPWHPYPLRIVDGETDGSRAPTDDEGGL